MVNFITKLKIINIIRALKLHYQIKYMKTLKKIWNYLIWLEEQRMKAAIKSGSAGPLL